MCTLDMSLVTEAFRLPAGASQLTVTAEGRIIPRHQRQPQANILPTDLTVQMYSGILILVRDVSHTVRLSVIVRTILPAPATSTSFSCQLSNTLIA